MESGGEEIGPNDIPRIAEEISFIKGCPEGDIPNLEVDAWRTDATDGIPIQDGMTLSFHYVALTGDQCAITNIRVSRGNRKGRVL